ncbi:hypothetical protein P389DRAFT_105660 [Cystobasidium minutum MCA 4210]|uniref:uncharacterized protein n=1 Tax=Cystobasidium minutum MCA 4210 TaxID=1397322 RepID=UPI0034CD4019|eukprot:jgi/Rhomi1/105660/CE105659_440
MTLFALKGVPFSSVLVHAQPRSRSVSISPQKRTLDDSGYGPSLFPSSPDSFLSGTDSRTRPSIFAASPSNWPSSNTSQWQSTPARGFAARHSLQWPDERTDDYSPRKLYRTDGHDSAGPQHLPGSSSPALAGCSSPLNALHRAGALPTAPANDQRARSASLGPVNHRPARYSTLSEELTYSASYDDTKRGPTRVIYHPRIVLPFSELTARLNACHYRTPRQAGTSSDEKVTFIAYISSVDIRSRPRSNSGASLCYEIHMVLPDGNQGVMHYWAREPVHHNQQIFHIYETLVHY